MVGNQAGGSAGKRSTFQEKVCRRLRTGYAAETVRVNVLRARSTSPALMPANISETLSMLFFAMGTSSMLCGVQDGDS